MTMGDPDGGEIPVWMVVLSWNGLDDTMDLLSGLRAEPTKILVVDNGSSDGTLTQVRKSYPDVLTLQTGENLGFAGGNNAGISFALSAGAEIIGILNNDTVVEPGFLAPLIEALGDAASDNWSERAVSPDIRYADDPEESWWRGSILDYGSGWPRHLTMEEQPSEIGAAVPTQLLTGCCILARADTWRRVGLFDERLFLIYEDSDWCMRAASEGVEMLVVPESTIRHKVSKSFTGSANALGSYYFARNGLIFATRYLGVRPTIRFLFTHVVRRSLREAIRRREFGPGAMRSLGVSAAAFGRRGPAGRLATWSAVKIADRNPQAR
jgi:GT2 family glycosyltransferase